MPTYAHLFDSIAFRTPNLKLFLWDKVRGRSFIMSYRLGVGGGEAKVWHIMTGRMVGVWPIMMYDNDRGGVWKTWILWFYGGTERAKIIWHNKWTAPKVFMK